MDSFKVLEKLVQSKRIGHAYIFSGPDKEILEKASQKFVGLLGVQGEDLFKIDLNGEEIKVGITRALLKKINLSPLFSPFKMAIISRAENLNAESASALLKVLEEPRGKTVIILLTSLPQSLLPTILSRCQILNFYEATTASGDEIESFIKMDLVAKYEYLEKLAQEDKITIIKVLNNWLIIFRQKFLNNWSDLKIRLFLKKLIETSFYLQTTNINPRLALEALILDL